MSNSVISLGLGLGGGRSATSSGRAAGGGAFSNAHSLSLDGTNDYMQIDTGSINLYGFSCWFKSDQAFDTSSGNLAVLLGYTGTSYFLALGGNITGDFSDELITIRASSQNSFAYNSAGASIDTGWHHIVGAWSTSAATTGGNGYDIYLDGVKVGNAAGSATPSSPYVIGSSAFRIGQRQDGAYAFDGLIDEVSIFTSALSASDIATLYNSGVPGDISSLNPFGWWRCGDNDGGTGTTVTDQGSGSNDGTLVNGAAFSTTVPSATRFSKVAVDFDGTNDSMAIGSSYDLGCLSLWFKPDSTITTSSPAKAIVGFTGVSNFAAFAGVQTGTVAGDLTNELITLYTGDWVYGYTSSSATIDTNWHHLAIRWGGSDYEIYLDGVQVKNADGQVVGNQSKAKIPISNFNVAKRNDNNRFFAGLIDEVAIWSTPLSASDTIALYNSGTPGDLTSLSPNGWWRMGENNNASGTTITDQGSGSNNGTLTNGPTFAFNTP